MFERLKGFTNKWFENQRDPEIRHEFPLYDLTDNLYQKRDKEPTFDLPNNLHQANDEMKLDIEVDKRDELK